MLKLPLVTDQDLFPAAGVCPKQCFQNLAAKYKTLNELTGGEGVYFCYYLNVGEINLYLQIFVLHSLVNPFGMTCIVKILWINTIQYSKT